MLPFFSPALRVISFCISTRLSIFFLCFPFPCVFVLLSVPCVQEDGDVNVGPLVFFIAFVSVFALDLCYAFSSPKSPRLLLWFSVFSPLVRGLLSHFWSPKIPRLRLCPGFLPPLLASALLCPAFYWAREHAETSSPVNQSMSGIVGKRSWCSGLELPDFSLLNRSSPCETKGMVNSGIKTASFGMEKNDRLWIGPYLFEMYQLGPLINKFLILPLD